jgi:hypothetical protein
MFQFQLSLLILYALTCCFALIENSQCKFLEKLVGSRTRMAHAWNSARLEIGLKEKVFSQKEMTFIKTFWYTTHGISVFRMKGYDEEIHHPSGETHEIAYLRFYKAGNIQIDKNLITDSKNKELTEICTESSVVNDFTLWRNGYYSRPPTFTFAREPFERFESGYREYIDRCVEKFGLGVGRLDEDRRKRSNVTVNLLQSEFNDLLNAKEGKCTAQNHIFPISGGIRSFHNLMYVGKFFACAQPNLKCNFDDGIFMMM